MQLERKRNPRNERALVLKVENRPSTASFVCPERPQLILDHCIDMQLTSFWHPLGLCTSGWRGTLSLGIKACDCYLRISICDTHFSLVFCLKKNLSLCEGTLINLLPHCFKPLLWLPCVLLWAENNTLKIALLSLFTSVSH